VHTPDPSTPRAPALRLDPARRVIPITLGLIALGSMCLLLAWDAFPQEFPGRAHDVLGALPLALTAIAYLVYETLRHPSRRELVKATILAAAFMSWAANQAWPLLPQATLLNDIAIALFVLDAFLVIMGWPPGSHEDTLAETRPCNDDESDPTPDRQPRGF
jgi:hypothetical protein